jgi:hypothetical protein
LEGRRKYGAGLLVLGFGFTSGVNAKLGAPEPAEPGDDAEARTAGDLRTLMEVLRRGKSASSAVLMLMFMFMFMLALESEGLKTVEVVEVVVEVVESVEWVEWAVEES